MNAILKPSEAVKPTEKGSKPEGRSHQHILTTATDAAKYKEQIAALNKRLNEADLLQARMRKRLEKVKQVVVKMKQAFNAMGGAIDQFSEMTTEEISLPPQPAQLKRSEPAFDGNTKKSYEPATKTGSGAMRMLEAANLFYPGTITKKRMCAIAGLKPTSGTTSTYISSLKSSGLLESRGQDFIVTEEGRMSAGPARPMPTGIELINFWLEILGGSNGAGRMLTYLGKIYPGRTHKEDLAHNIGMAMSGSFSTYLSTLNSYDLLDRSDGLIGLSKEFFG